MDVLKAVVVTPDPFNSRVKLPDMLGIGVVIEESTNVGVDVAFEG